MKVKYSQASIADLEGVVELIESENPYAVRRLAVDLQESVDRLKQFSRIGLPVLKAPNPEQIRDVYVGHYTVRYLITDEAIFVLRVWHNKEHKKILNKIMKLRIA